MLFTRGKKSSPGSLQDAGSCRFVPDAYTMLHVRTISCSTDGWLRQGWHKVTASDVYKLDAEHVMSTLAV